LNESEPGLTDACGPDDEAATAAVPAALAVDPSAGAATAPNETVTNATAATRVAVITCRALIA
jgi:hypothetical protein